MFTEVKDWQVNSIQTVMDNDTGNKKEFSLKCYLKKGKSKDTYCHDIVPRSKHA